jgi:hypothetical protein
MRWTCSPSTLGRETSVLQLAAVAVDEFAAA